MPEKDPTNWTLATWALIIGMSIFGGMARVLAKISSGGIHSVSLVGFLADLATSGLVGVATFMIMISFDYPVALCAAAAGMSGHMATRIIFLSLNLTDKIAWMLGKKIESQIGKPPRKKDQ